MLLDEAEDVVAHEVGDLMAEQQGQVGVHEDDPPGAVQDGQSRRQVPFSRAPAEDAATVELPFPDAPAPWVTIVGLPTSAGGRSGPPACRLAVVGL